MSTPPVAARPAVASDALADLVRGPRRRVHVLASFRAAVYLAHDDGVVALVTADGVAHPNAIVDTAPTAEAPFAGVRVHESGWIGRGHVVLARRHLRVTRWFDPVPRLQPVAASSLAEAVAAARTHVAAARGRTPADLAGPTGALVEALLEGDEAIAVAVACRLLGRGPGLTPAGDDVLAGLLAATPALARALRPPPAGPDGTDGGDPPTGAVDLTARVRRLGVEVAARARDATTTVSAALLDHAARGAVAAPAAAVLHALTGRRSLPASLDGLLAVGSTSGRDLAVGLLAAADLVLAHAPATTTDTTAGATTDATTSPFRIAPARSGVAPVPSGVAPAPFRVAPARSGVAPAPFRVAPAPPRIATDPPPIATDPGSP